jgi:hypothetical protein
VPCAAIVHELGAAEAANQLGPLRRGGRARLDVGAVGHTRATGGPFHERLSRGNRTSDDRHTPVYGSSPPPGGSCRGARAQHWGCRSRCTPAPASSRRCRDAARAGGGQPRASPSSACHPVALSSYDQVVSPASAGSGVVVRSCRLSADAQRGPGLPEIHLIVDVREPEGDVVCDGHQAGAVHPDLPPQLDAGLGVVAGAQRQLSLAARPSHASPTPWSRSAFTSSPAVARIGSERGGRCTRAPSSLEHASRAKKRVGMEIRTHRVSPPRDRVTRLHWPTDVRTAFRRLCQVAGV